MDGCRRTGCSLLGQLISSYIARQTQDNGDKPLTFEVFSVRQNKSRQDLTTMQVTPDGHRVTNGPSTGFTRSEMLAQKEAREGKTLTSTSYTKRRHAYRALESS
jgi:hypothetical protein